MGNSPEGNSIQSHQFLPKPLVRQMFRRIANVGFNRLTLFLIILASVCSQASRGDCYFGPSSSDALFHLKERHQPVEANAASAIFSQKSLSDFPLNCLPTNLEAFRGA